MQNQYTVLTGASSGIGLAAAEQFAARGHNLVLTARRKERLESLRDHLLQEYPELDILVVQADLTLEGAPEELYGKVRSLPLRTWINCAGCGMYGSVAELDASRLKQLIRLDVEALAVLSALFVRDFADRSGAQLINVSSCGGYVNVPDAAAYCACKFFVSSFTEGIALELAAKGARMRAKVFAPAATSTEFGHIANNDPDYSYDAAFPKYHTAREAAKLLLELYDSDSVCGIVNRESFEYELCSPVFPNTFGSASNQVPRCRKPAART